MRYTKTVPILLLTMLIIGERVRTSPTSPQKFVIEEEASVGQQVGVIKSSVKLFSDDLYFAVDAFNGTLSVRDRIDCDADANLCNLGESNICVHAFHIVANGLMLQIEVTIVDKNDNAPAWIPSPPDPVRIQENAKMNSRHSLPLATDIDRGNFSIVHYEIDGLHDNFRLQNYRQSDGRITPELIVVQQLDRESRVWYNFSMTAFDGGHLIGQTKLSIEITDVNDNQPVFNISQYYAKVEENAHRGYKVLDVLASDKDDGINAIIVYSFAPEYLREIRYAFSIGANSGAIQVNDTNEIDYEKKKSFNFVVVARDKGEATEETRANVHIDIIDINDHQPIIQAIGMQQVYENRPAGTFFSYVQVKDLDAGEAGQVTCDIDRKADFNLILMSQSNGLVNRMYLFNLTTARPNFDREKTDAYTVIVTCYDHGTPRLTKSTRIQIPIEDENDETPNFYLSPGQTNLRFTIDEERTGVVAHVQATDGDKDENSRLTYTLQWNSKTKLNFATNPFVINDAGEISVAKGQRLDRESFVELTNEQGQLNFGITATDHGKPSRNASVNISMFIRDINDNAPEFQLHLYEFHVPENAVKGAFVGTLNATDKDNPQHNGKVIYEILDPVPFRIHQQGRIWVEETLDRESISSYKFRVKATDQPLNALQQHSAITHVQVVITDVNDNEPQFYFPNSTKTILHTMRVSYRESSDFNLAHIQAEDRDAENNGKVTYSIVSGDVVNRFYLNPESGYLKFRKMLSHSEMGEVVLGIEARDQGDPSLSSRQTLKVIIDDKAPLSGLMGVGQSDMELNKIIIVGIVITTGVICAVLITAICVMARRQPCFAPCRGPLQPREFESCSNQPKIKLVDKSFCLPLTERACDHRLGAAKFRTFLQPSGNVKTKLMSEQVFETNSESDGDSGKGGSVNNVRSLATNINIGNSNNYDFEDLTNAYRRNSTQSSLSAMKNFGGAHNAHVNAAAPVPHHVLGGTLERCQPSLCNQKLAAHVSRGNNTSAVYHTLYKNKTPSVIYEHQASNSSSLV